MTDFELQAFLELLARLVECKATDVKDAVRIIREAKPVVTKNSGGE